MTAEAVAVYKLLVDNFRWTYADLGQISGRSATEIEKLFLKGAAILGVLHRCESCGAWKSNRIPFENRELTWYRWLCKRCESLDFLTLSGNCQRRRMFLLPGVIVWIREWEFKELETDGNSEC